MSGHSKWAGIKHQKAIADNRRGQAFTKLANVIALAAKQGGADPEMNFKLRLAINQAKAANMPSANIERSIKRGSGQGDGAQLESILYEGYGPGGAGILIDVTTDNRNRTASDVRSILTKQGGRLAEAGSVKYLFDQKGLIYLKAHDLDEASLGAIEAGAEDVEIDDGQVMVQTVPNQLDQIRSRLIDAGYEVTAAELSFLPHQTIKISDTKAAQALVKLMDRLEENDDVTATYANFEIDQAVLDSVA